MTGELEAIRARRSSAGYRLLEDIDVVERLQQGHASPPPRRPLLPAQIRPPIFQRRLLERMLGAKGGRRRIAGIFGSGPSAPRAFCCHATRDGLVN